MAPNSLKFYFSSTYFVVTLSVCVLELILILSMVNQTLETPSVPSTSSRNFRKSLRDTFALSNFDFDWEQQSWDNLRLWRWRNRNRDLRRFRNIQEERNRGRKVSNHRLRDSPQQNQKVDGKRGRTREEQRPRRISGGDRISIRKKSDPFLTRIIVEEDSCCPTVTQMITPFSGRNATGHLVELYQDANVHQRFHEISCRYDVQNQPCKFLENRHSKLSKCVQQHAYTYALVRPAKNSTSKPAGLEQDVIIFGSSKEFFPNQTMNHHHQYEHIISSKKSQNSLDQSNHQKINIYSHNGGSHLRSEHIEAIVMANGAVIRQPWYLDHITVRSGCSCHISTNADSNKRRKKDAIG